MIGVGDRISTSGQVYEVKTVSRRMEIYESYRDDSEELAPRQVRMDEKTRRLVILVHQHYHNPEDIPSDVDYMPWTVQDVLSGEIYVREEDKLWGEIYNEMETLAWASEDDIPDPEVEGD